MTYGFGIGRIASAYIPPGSGLVFNLIYDPSWSSAPASYQTGSVSVVQACSLLSAAFPHVNATINLHVGYGTYWLSAGLPAQPIGASSSIGNVLGVGGPVAYSTLRSQLAGLSFQSASLAALLANTPAGASLNSVNSFNVPSAVCKAIGLFGLSGGPTSATDTIVDGSIGMGSGWADAKLLGVFLHELTHAMGRIPAIAPSSWSRFTSVGNRQLGTGTSGCYFSLDGGTTQLATYGNNSDVGDFLNLPDGTGVQDPLDCFGESQETGAYQFLTSLDLQLMNSMGFQ